MKILCLCSAGECRSVAMARELKSRGHDAIAAGVDGNGEDTVAYLCEWADRIVVAERGMVGLLPEGQHHKVAAVEIGPDEWGNNMDPDIRAHVKRLAGIWKQSRFATLGDAET